MNHYPNEHKTQFRLTDLLPSAESGGISHVCTGWASRDGSSDQSFFSVLKRPRTVKEMGFCVKEDLGAGTLMPENLNQLQ